MADVEKRATLAILEPFTRSERLVAEIETNDKTPLTDGFVTLYEGLSRKKTTIIGRVDVQVKGRTVKQKLPPSSFSMKRTELEAIQRHGTIVLLVSHVRADGTYVGKPMYAVLSYFTVTRYLDEMKRKAKSFSVPLRDLPEALSKVESIIAIAIRTKTQRVFADSGDLGRSGLQLLERSVSFRISSATNLTFDEPFVISPETGDFIIEVETPEGITIPLPGDLEIRPASYSPRPLGAVLRCGDLKVHDATIRQIDASRHEITITEGLSLTNRITDGKVLSGAVSLTLPSNLEQRVRAIDLFLEMASGTPLYLDDRELAFDFHDNGDLGALREVRARLEKLLRLFAKLHVPLSVIEMDQITPEQLSQLGYLYDSMFDGLRLSTGSSDSTRALVYVEVGPWRLNLIMLNNSGEGDVPIDIFDPENWGSFRLYSTDESGEPIEVQATVYELFDREMLASILNLNLAEIVAAYERIDAAPNRLWLANQSVLSLIHAADECELRRREFLDAAASLNRWLTNVEGPTVPGILNRLQISLRLDGELTPDQKGEIRDLRRDILRGGSQSAMAEAGCAILLNDPEELADCMRRLSDEEQQQLKSYPIWTLTQNRSGILSTSLDAA